MSDKKFIKQNYTRKAKQLWTRKKYAEAETLLKEGLELFPNNERILCSLGQLFLIRGNLSEARRLFEQTLRINPIDEVALNSLGNSYLQEGNLSEARRLFEQTLRINPRNEVASYLLAKLYYQSNESQRAKQIIIPQMQKINNKIFLILFAAITPESNSIWNHFRQILGDKEVDSAIRISKDYQRFKQEEQRFYQNALFKRMFSSLPIDRYAKRGVIGLPKDIKLRKGFKT